MKKYLIAGLTIVSLCLGASVGYSFGSSNIMTYPSFTVKPPSSDSAEALEKYLEQAESYCRACQNDIEMITIEQNKVVEDAQRTIEKYQAKHGYKR